MPWNKPGTRFVLRTKPTCEPAPDSLESMLRAYLQNAENGVYGEHALETTVQDVLALDVDLKDFVQRFLEGVPEDADALRCDFATIGDLVQTEQFTPVTAALYLQWYRRNPTAATRFLLGHDSVTEIDPSQMAREAESAEP